MLEISDLAAFLRGSWRIERTVVDRKHGQNGTFSGTVELSSLADGGLHYHEFGTLDWLGASAQTQRDYRLLPTRDPAVLDWSFVNPNGSASYFFHTMNLGSGLWRANHPCAADTYQVEYQALSQDELSVVWDVTGPSKDNLLTSSWQRIL